MQSIVPRIMWAAGAFTIKYVHEKTAITLKVFSKSITFFGDLQAGWHVLN